MCLAFFVAEPPDMPYVVVAGFWLAMLGSGILYRFVPALDDGRWSRLHYWGHSVGLPLTIVGFLGITIGHRGWIQVILAVGSYTIVLCIIALAVRWVAYAVATKNAKR